MIISDQHAHVKPGCEVLPESSDRPLAFGDHPSAAAASDASPDHQSPSTNPRRLLDCTHDQGECVTLMGIFLDAVRTHGATTIEAVRAAVKAELGRRASLPSGATTDYLHRFQDLLTTEREAADALAHDVLLPQEERDAQKRQRSERYRRDWMAQQPPTPKQIALLRRLGDSGIVSSKLEASDRIDHLLRHQTVSEEVA